ncbi:MAG: superoxide dismutase [Cu-Zn] SodC [Leptolyngbyaceae cyanobacterium]
MRNVIQLLIAAIAGLVLATTIAACSNTTAVTPQSTAVVAVNLTNAAGLGDAVGTVTLEDTEYGLLLTPDLTGLSAGLHGFHVHENSDCGPGEKEGRTVPGLAAGGHFDPDSTGNHEGPYAVGHLGDLPPLYVDEEGIASVPVLAPRLTVTDVVQRSLMVHAEGDNFADEPAPLGGGGARLACGVI